MSVSAAVLVVALTAGGLFLTRDAARAWEDGEERGQFRSVYHGYGTVTGDDAEIILHPKSAEDLSVTHGGLVVTRETFDEATFGVVVTTEQQVRKDPPNPWEVGWVLWNHTDDDHFYAVALKPNGWEISKQDPAYPGKQRYLATGDEPTFPIGESRRVEVTQDNGEMTVSVDGKVLASVIDRETPYRSGSIGFYTEDALVRFNDLHIAPGNN
ncbi:LamG domain-containing protein [Tessaracoccus antarcticus]|uniref:Calcium-binding protein n=1 Tax=Tessaracoccus antarcticus TaxID=2479848 RepID=A0A3M0G615_9ACTN|nr:calcium-binding protein [Tessaracoccus antarcticus]RMB60335.1 calcium-binding protein [Tessaracoccus antarcticus]